MSISDLDPNVPGANAPAGEGDDHLRAINSALNEAFGAVNGPITNSGGTGAVGDTNPPDAATWSKLFDDVRALADGVSAGGTIQKGMCMLWSTSNGAIPSGWVPCQGQNVNNVSVPNLQDRFVVGAGGTYGDGEQGGSLPGTQTTEPGGSHSHATKDHALTVAELPSALNDNINISISTGGDGIKHENTSFAAGGESSGTPTSVPMSVSGTQSAVHNHGETAIIGAHTHVLGAGSLPPFTAYTWICYVGSA